MTTQIINLSLQQTHTHGSPTAFQLSLFFSIPATVSYKLNMCFWVEEAACDQAQRESCESLGVNHCFGISAGRVGSVLQVPAAGAEQQGHQAHEEQCHQEEELGGEGPGGAGPAGTLLLPLVLQVVVHGVSQAVLVGRVAQLTTSLVNLKGMTDGNVPHLRQS